MKQRFQFVVAFCLAVASIPVFAQTSGSAPAPAPAQKVENSRADAPKPLTWDAVSIKPHHALDGSAMTRMLPDGYEIQNFPLYSLMAGAFPIRSNDQLVGWPAWAGTERYDVLAKMDAETAAAYHKLSGNDSSEQWQLLMRQILEERMGLKFHIEKRELPVYELVVAKHGSKLKASAPGETGYSGGSPGKFWIHALPVSSLAGWLSGIAGRNVYDKTGLAGLYDVEVTYGENQDSSSGDSGLSIFTAVQEQLGLKLEPAKAPIDVYVIDHLERPSEN
jgi:uncharacterized protein (TIGR03435 family)